MRIDQIAATDFSDKWLACSRYGQIYLVDKHPDLIRWVFTLLSVVTFGCIDFYTHIRIKRIADGLYAAFKKDIAENLLARRYYIRVFDKLLIENGTPIKAHRAYLQATRNRVATYTATASE